MNDASPSLDVSQPVPPAPHSDAPVKPDRNPTPGVPSFQTSASHRYNMGQRVQFNRRNPLHDSEVNHTYRCYVATDDAESPTYIDKSKNLKFSDEDIREAVKFSYRSIVDFFQYLQVHTGVTVRTQCTSPIYQ